MVDQSRWSGKLLRWKLAQSVRGNDTLWQGWDKRLLGSDELSLVVYDDGLSCNIRRLDDDWSNLLGVLNMGNALVIDLNHI